ncbi:MAG: hypothetical protein JNN00_04560 [Chitinophagaceae bacterium]|nr:hypothetical protein [Chitinophagaceae bacterium]
MQHEKHSLSPAAALFQNSTMTGSSPSGSNKAGSLLSFAIGLALCFIACLVAGNRPVAVSPAGKQDTDMQRSDITNPDGVILIHNRMVVVNS